MADVIGRISVPTTVLSTGGAGLSGTQVFPLTTELSSYGFSVERPVVVHRFGSMDAKQEQRFYSGIGPRKFRFSRGNLGWTEARELRSFWESMEGPWEAFTYNVPNPGGTATSVLVTFEETPISFNYLRNACQTGFNLIEVVDPTAAPTYAVTSAPCLRFPSTALSTALLSEVQEIVPLIHIRVQEATVPDIWLSDRRVTLTDGAAGAVAAALGWAGSSQLYLPRVTGIGEPGSDVLISQDIKGSSDSVRFTFGNADRTMTDLSNDTDLKYAEIDFCAFNVNSGILIQIWKGVIQNFTSDGTPNFPVVCSDGFFQIMNQYPERQASRQCWKTYNDGVYCVWATKGASASAVTAAGGDPNSCDFYLESANGCQIHGMSPYFGGQQCDPQGVIIKDDSTGFLGFGRNKVTATSIITEYIWGLALPEIWCNSGGNALYAFMANALMVAYRDESTYADSLGILGAGPLGGFTPSQIVANADGYRYVVAPMVDGYTWQGFQVNGNLTITKNQPGMGLRQVLGNDPANPSTDYFSLGQGSPQTWEPNNYAAGVAFCEVRITKSSTIQPSTPDQHQMTIPLDYGLSGFVWDQNGNRSVVSGLINPFWICVNMLLRAMGLTAGLEAPLNTQTITITLPPSSFFSFSGSTIGDFEIVAFTGNPIGMWACFIAWIGSAFTGNAFSVPMSNAANQAAVLLAQNLYNWQSLAPRYQTAANQAIFEANFQTVWNAYVQACVVIAGPNPTGNAEKALIASVEDRMTLGMTLTVGSITFTGDGKYDWFAYYLNPITSSATPGDSMSYPSVSAQQLSAFVLSSLIVGDGSGTAEIAAAQVPAILGTGDEIQFQFQGSVSSQKPFRDWLTEVLNCCLGFYAWEFGKLKLGCRINASAVDAYTISSILFQSLKQTPIVAAFEHLIISYADVAYQYQTNTADYVDKSHAAYYGRAGSPLTSQMHSVGISTLSQALRIAATRTREECGGVTPMEWRNARNVSWQTTLLGLNNEVGQVISMTHPDIPGARGTCNVTGAVATWASGDVWTYAGTAVGDTELVNKAILIGGIEVVITAVASDGSAITTNPEPPSGTGLVFHVITMCFRVQRWSLKKDWSVQLDGQTVTASMYDLDVGPKPVDVAPARPSPIFYAIPAGPVWAPYQVQANASDALFPGEWTFDSDQVYVPLQDGGQQAYLVITGKLPVNEFSATGAGAPGVGLVGQSSTGGSLPAMVTLYVSICAIDSSGLPSVPSNILVIGTSVTGTDSFTLSNITWPAVTGLASFVLFVASQDDLICEQLTGALTPTGNGTTYSPSSFTFSGPMTRSTWAMPSPYVAKVRVKAKLLVHSGVIGASVASVSINTIVSNDMVDTSATPFNATGRVLSLIGRPNASTPYASFNITNHVPATGTLTLDRDPTGIVLVGDAFAIRFKADNLNSMPGSVTTVNDNGCKNSLNAYGGMGVVAGVGVEIGNLIRIIANTGRGQPPSTITANTATGLTFQPALTMDDTSVWIVEGATWAFQADSTSIDNASPFTPVSLSVPTGNFIKQPMLIGGFTVDVNGNESPDGDAPVREDWIYGAVGTNASPGATLQVAGTLAIGSNQAPPLQLNATRTPNEVVALVGTAPTGAGLTININVGGVLWMSLTIAAGNLSVQATSTQLTAAGSIAGSASITMDITAVGTTVPGADLSVFIYNVGPLYVDCQTTTASVDVPARLGPAWSCGVAAQRVGRRLHALRLLVGPSGFRGGGPVRRGRCLRALVHLAIPAGLLPGGCDVGLRSGLDWLSESDEFEVPFGGVGLAELHHAQCGRRRSYRDARHGGAAGYGDEGRGAGQLHVHRQRHSGGVRPRATGLPGQRAVRYRGAGMDRVRVHRVLILELPGHRVQPHDHHRHADLHSCPACDRWLGRYCNCARQSRQRRAGRERHGGGDGEQRDAHAEIEHRSHGCLLRIRWQRGRDAARNHERDRVGGWPTGGANQREHRSRGYADRQHLYGPIAVGRRGWQRNRTAGDAQDDDLLSHAGWRLEAHWRDRSDIDARSHGFLRAGPRQRSAAMAYVRASVDVRRRDGEPVARSVRATGVVGGVLQSGRGRSGRRDSSEDRRTRIGDDHVRRFVGHARG